MTKASPPSPLDSAALARLRLQRAPFAPAEADQALYSDAGRTTQLNVALQMLHASDRILLVRGETGIGKSTFLLALAQAQGSELATCRFGGNEALSLTDVCMRFASELGLAPEPGDSATDFLHRLWELGSAGRLPVLLLDDADRLSAGVLGKLIMLWQKAVDEATPFGLVLAVDRAFDQHLERLKQDLGGPERLQVINLYPLSERETAAYLQQRLQSAGGAADLLSAGEQRQVYVRSRGIPARIDADANRLLHAKANRRNPLAELLAGLPQLGQRPAAAVAAVAVVAGAIYGGLQWLERDAAAPPALVAESTGLAGSAPEPRTETPFGLPMPERHDFRDRRGSAEPANDPAPTPSAETLAEQPAAVVEPELQPAVADEVTAEHEATAVSAAPPPEATAAKEPAAGEKASEEQEPEAQPAEAQASGGPATTELDEPAAAEPIAATEPTAEPTPPAAATEQPRADSPEDWLLSRAPNHYTIQLIAAHDRAALQGYIAERQLETDAVLVHTLRDGRSWYVVVSGEYPSREAALQGLRGLPQGLRSSGAWVRSFDSIRETVVAAAD